MTSMLGDRRNGILDQNRLERELAEDSKLAIPSYKPPRYDPGWITLYGVRIHDENCKLARRYARVEFAGSSFGSGEKFNLAEARTALAGSGLEVPTFALYCSILKELYMNTEDSLLAQVLSEPVLNCTTLALQTSGTYTDSLEAKIDHGNMNHSSWLEFANRRSPHESLAKSIEKNPSIYRFLTGLDNPLFLLELQRYFKVPSNFKAYVHETNPGSWPYVIIKKDEAKLGISKDRAVLYPVKVNE